MSFGNRRLGWQQGKLEDLVFFQRGFDITQAQQREGMYELFKRRSATQWIVWIRGPGVETPGYHQISLREECIRTVGPWDVGFAFCVLPCLRFAAERHLMVARPFKAGIEHP